MTTDKVTRADPRSSGARKSLRTSVRGHSATQNVACSSPSTRTRAHSSCMAIGHGSVDAVVPPAAAGWGS
jgi:hypothetical protein